MASRSKVRIVWVAAAVLVAVIVGGMLFGNTITINQKLDKFVSQVRGESKYVVGTITMTATIDRSETYRGWWGIYLGETVVRLRVDGCQFQYLIPATQVKREDFQFDKKANRLIAVLPKPVLDEEFIDIPSAPSRWWVEKSSGWAKFNKNEVEKGLRENLRPLALTMAKSTAFDGQVDLVVKDTLKKTIQNFLGDKSVDIEIRWR